VWGDQAEEELRGEDREEEEETTPTPPADVEANMAFQWNEEDQPEQAWETGVGEQNEEWGEEPKQDTNDEAWNTAHGEEAHQEEANEAVQQEYDAWTSAQEEETVVEASDAWATMAAGDGSATAIDEQSAAWQTAVDVEAGKDSSPRRESAWKHGVITEDMYCDDELNGDDPNLQLQLQPEEGGAAASSPGASAKVRPVLVDQGEVKVFMTPF